MPKSVLILILVIIALSSIIALAIVGPNTDRTVTNLRRTVFHPEAHKSRKIGVEPSGRITHAEFVSIIFPAFGLDSRTLKTATLEDRIDVLESLSLAPVGGYQPGKTLTVKEASVALAEVAARLGRQVTTDCGVPSRPFAVPSRHPGFAFSEADEQPISADELAAAIQPDTGQQRTVEVEAQATTTVTVETQAALDLSIQTDETEELRRLLKEKLVEYYNPRYTQPLSLTD